MSAEKKYTKTELLNEIEVCREEIAKDPENSELYFQLAHYLELDGSVSEAIQAYQTVVAKNHQNKNAYYRLGLCYSKSGFKERAIDSLEAVLNIDDQDAEIWCNLGCIHWEKNDLHKAKLCYANAQKIDKNNIKILQSLSLLNYLLKNYQQALDLALVVQKESSKDNIENSLHLAMCYVAVNNYKDAITQYEKVLAQKHDNLVFFNNYANCLKLAGETSKAEEFYLKSLAQEPKNSNFNFNYGEFLYDQKEQIKAIPFFQNAIRQDGEDIDSLNYLAKCFEDTNPKESFKLYQKIISIDNQNIGALFSLANIQEKFAMYSDSLVNRQRVYAIKKNHWKNNLALGKAYLSNKKITEGWELLKYNPLVTAEHIYLLERVSDFFQYHKNHSLEIDALQLILKFNKEHIKTWARLAEIVLKNKDVLRAYTYALKTETFLQGDVLFAGRLTQGLLNKGEVEKAIEISCYLIKTADIDPCLLLAILKNFNAKNLIAMWLKQTSSVLKQNKDLFNIIKNIFLELNREDQLQQLQDIMQ